MKKLIAFFTALVPSVAFAQVITDFNSLTYKLTNIGNVVIEILIAFAIIYIIFNVIRFIMNSGSEDAAKYRTAVLWGIVGLAVILSIWGLVAILTNTFRTNTNQPTNQFPRVTPPQQIP